jgi:hypothetical protein
MLIENTPVQDEEGTYGACNAKVFRGFSLLIRQVNVEERGSAHSLHLGTKTLHENDEPIVPGENQKNVRETSRFSRSKVCVHTRNNKKKYILRRKKN